jgi:hypothetical protein
MDDKTNIKFINNKHLVILFRLLVNILGFLGVYKKVRVLISSSLWNCGCRRKERRRKA